jgi:RNA polymerase sigma factor (sigma-70 family)
VIPWKKGDVHGDDDVWRRLVDGDEQVWLEAGSALWKPVCRFFVNKVGDDAQDLAQQTFSRLQDVRSHYAGRGSPRAFVMGVARLILLEYYRERRRDPTLSIEDVSVAEVGPRPSSVLVARAEQRLVLAALRRLTLDHQIVLELYYWENMTDPEIATVLDTNENTIRGRRTRARDRMREVLGELERGAPLPHTSMDLDRWARGVVESIDRSPSE